MAIYSEHPELDTAHIVMESHIFCQLAFWHTCCSDTFTTWSWHCGTL